MTKWRIVFWGDFFDYTITTLLTTYRAYARPYAASLIEGVLRKRPEDGARRGVLRRRLVTVRPGRLGTPPARHYDLAAELAARIREMPAVVWRRAPKETEARPRSLKSPRWSAERRASRVMGRKAPRKRLACRVISAFTVVREGTPHGCSAEHPNVSRRSAHPSSRVSEATLQTPGAENAPRERNGLFEIVRWNDEHVRACMSRMRCSA